MPTTTQAYGFTLALFIYLYSNSFNTKALDPFGLAPFKLLAHKNLKCVKNESVPFIM